MPELPEVETIRRDLEHVILGKEITGVEVRTNRLVEGDPLDFRAILTGNHFTSLKRRGKLLHFHLAKWDKILHLHLKMTGQLICQIDGGMIVGGHPMAKIEDLPNQYTHLVLRFDDGTTLYFNDVRTFGYAKLVPPEEHQRLLDRYGLEPLTPEFTWENVRETLAKRKGKLKAVLLNQEIFAGIGNIYADEICFRARLRPQRLLSSLSEAERKRLFRAAQEIIGKAVEKRGTTFSNFVDAAGQKGGYMPHLQVYGRRGERCRRCGSTVIKKITLAGRGTHFCELCQK